MVKPTTLYQQQQKQLMTRVTQLWRTLTELERQDWYTWAEANPVPSRLNPDAYLNGYNLFCAYHRYLGLSSNDVLESPSLTLQDIGTITVEILRDGSNLNLSFSNQDYTGSWVNLFFLTGSIPFGREFVNTTPRFIIARPFNAAETVNIAATYQQKIGSLPSAGEWVGLKYVRLCLTTAQYTITSPFQIEVIE